MEGSEGSGVWAQPPLPGTSPSCRATCLAVSLTRGRTRPTDVNYGRKRTEPTAGGDASQASAV